MADLAAGVAILLLGIGTGVGSFGIPPGAGYDRIGPRFFPSIVAAGLVMLGAWLNVAALRARRTKTNTAEDKVNGTHAEPRLLARDATNWGGLGYLGAGLLASLMLLERGGFVIASSVLFWLAARGFGSRRIVRDAVIAVALAVLVSMAFTRGLGLTLPQGIFGRLL